MKKSKTWLEEQNEIHERYTEVFDKMDIIFNNTRLDVYEVIPKSNTIEAQEEIRRRLKNNKEYVLLRKAERKIYRKSVKHCALVVIHLLEAKRKEKYNES